MIKAAVIGFAILCAPALPAADTAIPGVQGSWQLNDAASDSFKEKFKAIAKRPRGGFRQGALDNSDSRSWKRDLADQRARFERAQRVASAARLDIIGHTEITLTYDGEITRHLVASPNGRVYSASGQELVEDALGFTLTFWSNGVLVIETMTDREIKITETYRLDVDAGQLIVSISIKARGEDSLDLRRVYDRAEEFG